MTLAGRSTMLLASSCVLLASTLGAQEPIVVAKVDTAKRVQVLFTRKDGVLAAGVVGSWDRRSRWVQHDRSAGFCFK